VRYAADDARAGGWEKIRRNFIYLTPWPPLLTRFHRRGGNILEEGLTPLLDAPLLNMPQERGRNFERGLVPPLAAHSPIVL
jgi:hypothetical protein